MSRRRLVALVAVVIAASCSLSASAAASKAQAALPFRLALLETSAGPALPAHSSSLGPLRPSTKLHVDVTLKLPHPGAVTAYLQAISDRASPQYRKFLKKGEFGELFGPSSGEVAAVDAVLRADGLDPGPVTSNHLMIPLSAPAALVNRAFHISLERYRLPGGREVFTTSSPPSISAAVSPDIESVLGLNDLVQLHSSLARTSTPAKASPHSARLGLSVAGEPRPCDAAIAAAERVGSLTADRLASYYGLTPLYALGDFGQGVHVALAEFEANLPGDIDAYKACYGVHTTVNYIVADAPGPAAGPGSGEAALDIENVIGLAPRATIDVYQGVSSPGSSDIYNVYSDIVTTDIDQVVATGWGLCELDLDAAGGGAGFLDSEQSLFDQAAAQGQTVFAASGDSGSSDCYPDSGSPSANLLSVDDPASQPYVIGVGGTSIGATSETVWNDSKTADGGAGGGGVSAVECMPDYQPESTTTGQSNTPGLISADSVKTSKCATGYMREVPDVSADADPQSGYVIYWTPDTKGGQASWLGGLGGTSAATPLWAAIAALTDSSPFCADYGSTDRSQATLSDDATGLLAETLYYVADTPYAPFAFYDITSGNNYFAPAGIGANAGKLYPATVGYDMASGLGSPSVAYLGNFLPGLAALVCAVTATKLTSTQITRITPDVGRSTHSTRVTISGSGFLPIKGADELQVGPRLLTVSCKSTTRCTGVIPATKAGTVDLRMFVEALTESPRATPDLFIFVAAPTATRVRPLSGPAAGGTLVTVHGSGFAGTVRVRFGPRRGTHVHVYSPTRLTVLAPAGSGTVHVHVSALAGSSKQTAVAVYRYLLPKHKAPVVKRAAR
jgi:subtilase family serine protease